MHIKNLGERFSAECQWREVLLLGKGYNWVNFSLIEATFEYDKMVDQMEVVLALLGFRVRITIQRQTEKLDDLQRISRLVKSGLIETVPLEDLQVRMTEQCADKLGLERKE